MKTANAIDTLRDLAEQDLERAAIYLGDMRRGQHAANEQLTMLLDYQDEYRNKLNDDMSSGITAPAGPTITSLFRRWKKRLSSTATSLITGISGWNRR